MNKFDVVAEIAERGGFYKKDVLEIMDIYKEVVTNHLSQGDKISFSGMFTLLPIYVPSRTVRNPKTEKYSVQPAHLKIKVKISEQLKERINTVEDRNDKDERKYV